MTRAISRLASYIHMYAVYLSDWSRSGLARLFGEGRRGWMLPPRNIMNTYSAPN